MYIVRIHGGLGNQMFEYVFFRFLQGLHPGADVRADMSWYARNPKAHQGYELERVFGIHLPVASYADTARIHEYYPRYYPLAALRFLSRKIAAARNKGRNTDAMHIFDFGPELYGYNPVYEGLKDTEDRYIEGVFASDAYLMRREDVLQDFTFREPLKEEDRRLAERMASECSVAVHVRRGDYTGSVFDVIGPAYYEKAAACIREREKEPVFYVFSDDMEYVHRELPFLEPAVFVHHSGPESYRDMQMMSLCRHRIIANSSFSYWGAVLGERPASITVAPAKYKADVDLPLARKGWILI